MEIKKQTNIRNLLEGVKIPKMVKIRQHFPNNSIENVMLVTREKLRDKGLEERIKPGMRIVLTGSSRGIANMNIVLREIVYFVKELGGIPYIIPAMGSHGGATAEGQTQILYEYGITEEFCGCEIYSSMETIVTGCTKDNLNVYIDKFASECDAIIVVGRIKAHTAFRGKYESGLMKMLCVGLGKQKGANAIHDAGFGAVIERIPAFADVVLKNNNVIFGVGLIENALDETCRIEVIKSEIIAESEPLLLEYAKGQMAKILFPETDILIVRQIGKNFSGSGMDPNITGTWSTPYGSGGIRKQRTVVLDLSEESHGNALGIGQADITTMRLFDKIDFTALYPNILTSTVIIPCKIGMVMEDDKMAIKAAIKTCTNVDKEKIRIVMIKNTLFLEEIYVSYGMLEEVKKIKEIEILEGEKELSFDKNGGLLI